MAWLARSIASSLKLDEDEDDDQRRTKAFSGEESPSQSPRGVKEDLSELTKTLRSQFWGVASFLAPTPASSDHPEKSQTADHAEENRTSSDHEEGEEDLIAGIRSDFAEIGGRFKTGISKISGNIAVSEFTKIASNFLQLGSDEANTVYSVGDVVGVTEEVIAFARDIAMHPETWLDFPLPDEDDDFDGFEMSDAQQEHALAVERLAPALSSLRIELCPAYVTEGCFWRIYFVLLHPKLSKHDALLLSTPQVLEARALLSDELQKSSGSTVTEAPVDMEPLSVLSSNPASEPQIPPTTITAETTHSMESPEFETEKHPDPVVDKSVIEERPVHHHDKPTNPPTASSQIEDVQVEDDTDDWLKDEDNSGTTMPLGNDEDVSFSDLEEDDDDEGEVSVGSYKKVASPEWVQLKDVKAVAEKGAGQGSENKESNDWLDVHDIDVL
ncbi:PREDICTED: uncharacterized protein LOC104819270 [Tarenaya hassleriana]|uniref:uncharacterized protein LOC104819270 n=1 Tax=Tarenaya hassleriana TaxID=28532 RepID=UPI00053C083B|nr:PREDICTED: uncharacterized protein LOC104819270 [Tarenaya hassleriana]